MNVSIGVKSFSEIKESNMVRKKKHITYKGWLKPQMAPSYIKNSHLDSFFKSESVYINSLRIRSSQFNQL